MNKHFISIATVSYRRQSKYHARNPISRLLQPSGRYRLFLNALRNVQIERGVELWGRKRCDVHALN